MSPGSGALYRHFRSKGDVLRAALRRGLDRMRASQQTITDNADLVRLILHEPDAAPDMVEELWVHNLVIAHQIMGQALQASAQEAGTEIDDPEAISAVLLAALSYMPIMQVLLGRAPGDMDPDRFRDAWLRLSRSVFTHGVPRLVQRRQLRGLIVAAQRDGLTQ
jgi:AcrR family transcriptional regulator